MSKIGTYIVCTMLLAVVSGCASGARNASDMDSSREGVEKICQQYNDSVSEAAYHNCVARYMGAGHSTQ